MERWLSTPSRATRGRRCWPSDLVAQLDPAEEAALAAHLDDCAACAAEARSLLAVSAVALGADPHGWSGPVDGEEAPAADLGDRVLARVRRARRRGVAMRAAAVAGATAAVVAVVVAMTGPDPASEPRRGSARRLRHRRPRGRGRGHGGRGSARRGGRADRQRPRPRHHLRPLAHPCRRQLRASASPPGPSAPTPPARSTCASTAPCPPARRTGSGSPTRRASVTLDTE